VYPDRVRTILIRALFLPTLVYNVILNRILRVRHWWDAIDDHVLLGALPFPSDVARLHREGVRGVVNTCVEYGGPVAAYRKHGIEQLHIPTLDFSPPRRVDIDAAVAFIGRCVDAGDKVYVHCKAGRGRSATVALCWLVARHGMAPEEGQRRLEERRPHVNRGVFRREVVQSFAADRSKT